jgi:hypothetical protein
VKYSALTRRWFEAAGIAEDTGFTAERAGTAQLESIARGSAGSIGQGTWVQFEIRRQGERIAAVRCRTFGCPHTIAIAAWLAAEAPNLPLAPRLPESPRALQHRFAVPVEKLGRILLVEDAWCAAIRAAITLSGPGIG